MTQHNDLGRNRRARAGLALLTVGMLVMFANLGLVAASLAPVLAHLGIEALGAPAALALAILRLFRTVAFHPAALLPFAYGILVLFVALAGILAGLVLLLCRRTAESA